MADPSRVRNLAVLLVLIATFTIPSLFFEEDRVLDFVSGLMLIFGIAGLWVISRETLVSFWSGSRDRSAMALYGLFALFLSVVIMRSYGIYTRNVLKEEALWLTESAVYGALVFMQFIGLWLFTRASSPPTVNAKPSRWGQLIAGILIGALLVSSRALEPILMFFSRLFGRMF